MDSAGESRREQERAGESRRVPESAGECWGAIEAAGDELWERMDGLVCFAKRRGGLEGERGMLVEPLGLASG